MRLFAYIWMAMFIGIPLVLLGVGVSMIVDQQDRLARYVPVPATIVSSEVRTSRSSKGHVSYSPEIRYRYKVEGHVFTASQITPVDISGSSEDWANEMVGKYPAGSKTTAWHDPVAVDQAFLMSVTAFEPYAFVLFPMLFISIGAVVGMVMLGSGKKSPPPVATESGDYALTPTRRIASRFRFALVLTLIWWGIGMVTVGHYVTVASQVESGAMALSAIYFGVGLIPLGMLLYYGLLRRTVSEPQVSVDVDVFRRGESFHVLVVQPVKMNVKVTGLVVALVCREHRRSSSGGKTRYSTHTLHEKKFELLVEGVEAPMGEPLSGLQELRIEAHLPPTSRTGYPQHDWHIHVTTKIAGRPDYRGKFAIEVV